MNKRNIPIIKEYTKKHKKRSTRQRVLMAVAILVVFCTTYAMILPAITMENKNKCTIEEHIHKSDCYGTQKVMTCQQEVGKIHAHNENCYTATGELTCKIDTTVEHAHTETCYTSKMTMVCDKPMHQHNEECTATAPSEAVTVVPTEKVTQTSTESTSDIAISEISKDSNTADVSSAEANNADVNSANVNTDEPTIDKDAQNFIEYLSSLNDPDDPDLDDDGEIDHRLTYEIRDSTGKLIEDFSIVYGENYSIKLDIYALKGILPDKYQYILPAGIDLSQEVVDGDVIRNDNINVGDYKAERKGRVVITFEFDDIMNGYDKFHGTVSFKIKIDNGEEKPEMAAVKKTGTFNESTGMFEFNIEATIPSYAGTGKFKRWSIQDFSVVDSVWYQNLEGSEITISYNEKDENGQINLDTKTVPHISQAGENDNIAYLFHANRLYLVNRCKCNSSVCGNLRANKCKSLQIEFGNNYASYTNWCTCWNLLKNSTVNIKYENNKNLANINDGYDNNDDLIRDYPGAYYINTVQLFGADIPISSTANVEIPKFIDKSSPEFKLNNEYVGDYNLIVNEKQIDLNKVIFSELDPKIIDFTDLDFSKIDKDNNQIPDGLFIQDKMSNAAYIPGTIKLTAFGEDTPEEGAVLEYGKDYEVQYVPIIPGYIDTIESTDVIYQGILNITIFNSSKYFGKYLYSVDYKAQAVHPDMLAIELIDTLNNDSTAPYSFDGELMVSNNATASIYSYPTSYAEAYTNFDESWKFRRLALTVKKIDSENSDIVLPGAKFGLYTLDGYEIATGVTDKNGFIDFATNVRLGIHFFEEQPYFVKELEPPKGYSLDSTEKWFYFADDPVNSFITIDTNIMFCAIDDNGSSVNNIMECKNEKGMLLPETGGCGTVIYSIAGSVLMLGSAYALYKKSLRWRGVRR